MNVLTQWLWRLPVPVAGRAAPWRRLARRVCAVLAAGWLATLPVPCLAEGPLEVGVKAAYLYRFLPFVEWPAAPGATRATDAPLNIGVIGADAVHAELQKLISGRHVNGRPLTSRRLNAGEVPDGLHALYIGREAATDTVLSAVKGRPVLTVTDVPAGLPEGGMLNFLLVDGRVRFEASAAYAERAGLRLSARLLAVAERVVPP